MDEVREAVWRAWAHDDAEALHDALARAETVAHAADAPEVLMFALCAALERAQTRAWADAVASAMRAARTLADRHAPAAWGALKKVVRAQRSSLERFGRDDVAADVAHVLDVAAERPARAAMGTADLVAHLDASNAAIRASYDAFVAEKRARLRAPPPPLPPPLPNRAESEGATAARAEAAPKRRRTSAARP